MNRNTHNFEKIKSNAQPKVKIKKSLKERRQVKKIGKLPNGKNEIFHKYQKRRDIKNYKKIKEQQENTT